MSAPLNQPLLAAQKQGVEQKTAAPPPAAAPPAAKKKKRPWRGLCKCSGDYEATLTKALERSWGLFWCLITATYVAVTAHCGGPFWPKFLLSCKIDPGAYQTLNGSGHPECYNHCTPLNMQTAFDIILADLFMCGFWVVGELLIKMFDLELKDEIDGGKAYQKKLDAAERQQHIVLAEDRRKNVRHAPEWNEQIKGWKERQKLQKKVSNLHKWSRAYTFYFIFWCLFVAAQYMVCVTAPKVKSYSRQYGMPIYYWTLIKSMGSPTFSGPYDYVIWSVVFLEAILFFAAAAVVSWPKPPLIRGVKSNANVKFYEDSGIGTKDLLTVKPRDFFKKETGIVQLIEDEHGGLIQDTCLLVACHMSTLTPERTATFSATIRSALKVFPAHAIFVCDNGPWQNPVDRTDQVCKAISRQHDPSGQTNINYLFIPEGNKSHAMYWATEYWIPELVRRGELQEYQFALMIDDDVPLPPDLHVPNNTLNRNPAIKACAYVIQAATEDGRPNNLVSVQDLEYKMAGFIKQFQFAGGTTVCCHGAIALWRRDVLGSKILWDHDTVFHGEDLYMGLLLHRMRANYGIMVSASAVVPTFAPERMLILFRQRVTSWDLCNQRKFMSYGREVIFGWFAGTRAWIIKPFMFQECLNIVINWVRLYLVFGLAHLNPFSLIICFVVFYAVLYLEISIFNWGVLKGRPDLQVPLRTILIFPMYKTFCMLFSLYALMRNVIQYTTWRRKNIKISKREETVQDMPPVPPIINPDWHTIWHPNTNQNEGTSLVSLTENLVRSLGIHNMTDRRRITLIVQAYMLYSKLLKEDSFCTFPSSLSSLDQTSDDSKNHIILLSKAMETLRNAIPKKLKQMVSESGDWDYFRTQLASVMQQWEAVPETLFYADNLRNQSDANIHHIVNGNVHVCNQISQLIHGTNYPQRHDKVKVLKTCINNVLELLRMWKFADRTKKKRHSTALVLHKLLAKLEALKKQIDSSPAEDLPAILKELDQASVTVRTQDFEERWRTNIMMLIERYKGTINGKLNGLS